MLRKIVSVLAAGTLAWSALASSPPAGVTPLEAAATRVAPSGTASVQLLARGENAFLGKLTLQPGAAVPLHRDATEEYIHVLRGGGTMTIDGQTHAVHVGDTVYMPARAEVSFTNGDAVSEVLQVFAGPAPAAKYEGWKSR
jgi:quercetin dioxygenase-like cupin family protein